MTKDITANFLIFFRLPIFQISLSEKIITFFTNPLHIQKKSFNSLFSMLKHNSPYAKPLPQPLPEAERGGAFQLLPPALSGKGGQGGLGRIPLPQPLPGTERGSVSVTPPALSGKGGRGVRSDA